MVAIIEAPSGSDVTVTDLFCGAGGSSQGARKGGAIVKMAVNHWRLAVETHQTNFPATDHDCADVSQCDPRRYPRTNILIASPECTNHSSSKGVRRARQQTSLFGDAPDPGAERSRATMWDIPRFAERHHYEIVIVENVVEARQWVMWEAWIHAMRLLGYDYRCISFNSMFAYPTPQSRDRLYIVFWRAGNTAPQLDITPRAFCPRCAVEVAAVQSWKPNRVVGRYRKQYVYCCPRCAQVIEPYYFAAANAIDWSLPTPRIGDRGRPLREKTLARIEAGLQRFVSGRYHASPFALYDAAVPATVRAALAPQLTPYTFSMGAWDNVYRRGDEPLPAQTGSRSNGLVTPFRLGMGTWDDGATRALDAPADPQTTKRLDGVVLPFVCETGHGGDEHAGRIKPASAPASAQHTLGGTAVVTVPFAVPLAHDGVTSKAGRAASESLPTQTARQETGLAVAPFIAELRTHSVASSTSDPLATVVAGGNHHMLVEPPRAFTVAYYGSDTGAHPLDDALGAQTAHDRHAVVKPVDAGGASEGLTASAIPALEDCGFRVLAPHEVQRAMAFERDYVVLGTNRDKVRQLGNAVTPPVMELLIERCLATLRA